MRNVDVRRYAPVVVILVLVAAPLAIWAATSGGSGDEKKKGLIVERGVSPLDGKPELVLSIAGGAEVTSGASNVRVECMDANGKVIVQGTQPWPFVEEPGYPYPHAHQTDSIEKIEGARRCRVLGTNTRLDAAVQ